MDVLQVLTVVCLQQAQLLQFLEESHCIDLEYALRTCLRLEKKQACIKIYSLMGKYGQAVEMALQWGTDDGLDLAKVASSQDCFLTPQL